MKIGIISCVLKKKEGLHRADELYISDLFKKSYAYTKKHFDKIFILSAKYGLIEPHEIIKNYDTTLNNFSENQKKNGRTLYIRI